MAIEQDGQPVVELLFAIQRWCDRIEFQQRMQAQARHRIAPLHRSARRRMHEVQNRQQRLAARGQQRQFVAMLAQHRIARIDDVQGGVARQHFFQYAGFLFEAAPRFGRIQEQPYALRAIQAAVSAQVLDVLQQRDAVFHAGRIEPGQHGPAFQPQARALHLPRRAGAVGDAAEAGVPRQGAQQRGLARVRMAHHGDLQQVSHVRHPASAAAGPRCA